LHEGSIRVKILGRREDSAAVCVKNRVPCHDGSGRSLICFFICVSENAHPAFTLPTIIALQYKQVHRLGRLTIRAGLMFAFIVLGTIADWQQWIFKSQACAIKTGNRSQKRAERFLTRAYGAEPPPQLFREQADLDLFLLFQCGCEWAMAQLERMRCIVAGGPCFKQRQLQRKKSVLETIRSMRNTRNG